MKIGTWNVRRLSRAGPLKAAARELGRYIGLAQDKDRWRTLVSAVMNLGVQ